MKHLKILVVVNGPSEAELTTIKKAISHVFYKTDQMDIEPYISYEDVVAFKISHEIRDNGKEYGYFLFVGGQAYSKVQSQLEGSMSNVAKLGGIKTWSSKTSKLQVIATIEALFESWGNFHVEKKLLAQPNGTKDDEDIREEREDWILASPSDFERYLQIVLSRGRPQACIFRLGDEPYVEVVDATKKLRTPLQETTPVLSPDGLEIDLDSLRNAGYQSPYLLTLKEFMALVRPMYALAKKGRARFEVALETQDESKSD